MVLYYYFLNLDFLHRLLVLNHYVSRDGSSLVLRWPTLVGPVDGASRYRCETNPVISINSTEISVFYQWKKSWNEICALCTRWTRACRVLGSMKIKLFDSGNLWAANNRDFNTGKGVYDIQEIDVFLDDVDAEKNSEPQRWVSKLVCTGYRQ
jgi:hypothetical protein